MIPGSGRQFVQETMTERVVPDRKQATMGRGARKRILFVSSHLWCSGLRVLSSIVKEDYDTALLVLDAGMGFLKATPQDHPLDAGAVAAFCGGYDYVLFSATPSDEEATFRLADAIRQRHPAAVIIIGGRLGIIRPEKCLAHADYVCVFEGEGLLKLLHSLEGGSARGRVGNFINRAADLGGPIERVNSLDEVPVADYRMREYCLQGSEVLPLRVRLKTISYETSRGCAYDCSFCGNTPLNRIKRQHGLPLVLFKSIENVMMQLQELKKLAPELERFSLCDENFLARDSGGIAEFSRRYDREVGVPFHIWIDPRSGDFRGKAGSLAMIQNLQFMMMGMQTGSDTFNAAVYNRNQEIGDFIEKYRFLRKALNTDVAIMVEIIYGHPQETVEDIIATINAMLRLDGASFILNQYVPLPGTPLAESYPAGDESPRYLSNVSKRLFARYPFYTFMLFLIKYLHSYRGEFLLRKSFRKTRLTELLNSRALFPLYWWIVRFSIWHGHQKEMGWVVKERSKEKA